MVERATDQQLRPPVISTPTTPEDPWLKAAVLDRVLLNIGELNNIVGST